MSILIQKEFPKSSLFSQTIDEQPYNEILSFLEQIRSFQIPSVSSSKEKVILLENLRLENNS